MSLSDELLGHPNLARIRGMLSDLTERLEAESAFLIDEAGAVFAAVGHLEFRYPSPLPELTAASSDRAILEALLGEQHRPRRSPLLLLKVCPRALLVLQYEEPIVGWHRRTAKAKAKRVAGELKGLLELQ